MAVIQFHAIKPYLISLKVVERKQLSTRIKPHLFDPLNIEHAAKIICCRVYCAASHKNNMAENQTTIQNNVVLRSIPNPHMLILWRRSPI